MAQDVDPEFNTEKKICLYWTYTNFFVITPKEYSIITIYIAFTWY
jgi:hypothetical protein